MSCCCFQLRLKTNQTCMRMMGERGAKSDFWVRQTINHASWEHETGNFRCERQTLQNAITFFAAKDKRCKMRSRFSLRKTNAAKCDHVFRCERQTLQNAITFFAAKDKRCKMRSRFSWRKTNTAKCDHVFRGERQTLQNAITFFAAKDKHCKMRSHFSWRKTNLLLVCLFFCFFKS